MAEMSSSNNGSQVKRQPMKTNVFQHLIAHTGVPGITALFPYLHPGAIVMGGVYSLNYPGSPEFNFHHTNDCEELFISLVSNNFQRPFGMLGVGAKTHEVDNHTGTQESNPDAYTVALVIQRNKEKPPQREVLSIYCSNEECKKLVFRKEMDNFEGEEQPYYPEFKTITVLGPDAVNEFNQSDRTCKNCGTVLPHFPIEDMSWSLYTRQVRLANRARADYERFLANQSTPKPAVTANAAGEGNKA